MKRNPRLQLEILLAVLAALCAALLALLVFVEPLLLIPAGLALVLILRYRETEAAPAKQA